MSKLKALENYTASEISEASLFSPALKNYLGHAQNSSPDLHQRRNQVWIQASLGTILNSESALNVCQSWSDTAYELLKQVFETCFAGTKTALFALGKLGSHELNLSSDVDLLILADSENADHLKALRQFQKILTERTARGFVFRVDFDLRPGGRSGPLIPTIDQFIDYYGNYGETWERLAFVRLNSIAGDAGVISQAEAFAKKFTYRKHLDYTLLEDLKSLRGKIRQHYSARSSEKIWDLKLGVGGIRDVELFIHALQVIHGGKNPKLQIRSTQGALQVLKDTGVLPTADCEFLERHYWNLRALENFVQSVNDEQIHLLDKTAALPSWAQKQIQTLDEDLKTCDRIVGTLLGYASESSHVALPESLSAQEIWKEILEIEVLSRAKERDEQARLHFLNEFYETLQNQKGDTEKALLHLKDFIKSTRAKASFFTLLIRNKSLMDELAWLFGHSSYLSQILSSRPELIDSYVYRSQDLQLGDLSVLLEQLVEKRLLGELINGSHFLEDRNVELLQARLSETADEICNSLLNELKTEYPSDLEILALGKWGGRELGFRSDLDFILVSQNEPGENEAKLARRLIHRLTELRKGGSIFAIDMRLKPSGKAGPMVISQARLLEYLSNEAQAWERQAYLKARWLNPKLPGLLNRVSSVKISVEDLRQLEKIRVDLIRATDQGWDLKYAEGGLLDIELFSQTFLLVNSMQTVSTNTLDFLSQIPNAQDLRRNYLKLRQIEQMLQLVSTEGGAKVLSNHESFRHLATALQLKTQELEVLINSLFSENLQLLNQLDPRRSKKILDSGS